jgi:hypothetical protein
MRGRLQWAIPAAAMLCLLAPILFTDRTFASDWGNHMWLVQMQGLNISALHEPSIYLQSTLGAFYPYYAFYGGTFYAVTGLVSDLFDAELAVLFAYAGALAATYFGWNWMARQAGVTGWRQQLPGLIAVTAPMAVTNTYGRGGIPEAIGTMMLPLVAAAGISLVRESRMRLRDMAAFVVGLVFLTGSHALSMVWGLALLAVLGAGLIACFWPQVKERAMRLLGIAWLAVLAGAINAWMLGPTLVFRDRTMENEPDPITQTAFTEGWNLLRVLRNTPDYYEVIHGDINAGLPVLALVWALVCGAIFWRFAAPRVRALAAVLATVLAGLVAVILEPSLIPHLPGPLPYVQFPYRILVYANFCAVGLVTLALAAVERPQAADRQRRWAVPAAVVLAAIGVFSLVVSVQQNFEVRSWLTGRGEALASNVQPPPSWYAFLQFGDGEAPIVAPTLPEPLTVPVEEGIRDSYTVAYPPGPAGTAQTNIATGSYLVDVEGATPVGRSEAGQMVVLLPPSPDAPRLVEVSAKESSTVVVSRWISIVALLGSVAAIAAVLARRRRA